jgi:hypothetical protein
MDEKPDQIIDHIEAQREELGRNLSELENRVRRSTDWRTYFDKNPALMVGAALGGGVLLGSMVSSGRRSRSRKSSYSYSSAAAMPAGSASAATGASASAARRPSGPATSIQKSRIHETVDHVKAALIAFGISKAKEFLTTAIPGFDQHMDEAERSRREHHQNMSNTRQEYGQEFRSHTEGSGYRSGYGSASDYRSPETAGSPRA